ncbi:MAG: FG-GAP repeat domain-containing protein [Puniceicoccaceae bacterium]
MVFWTSAPAEWTYVEVDDARQKWGDWDQPDWLRYFGLAAGDLNNDGWPDLVSGRYAYLNPEGDLSAKWERIDFGLNTDGMLIVDADGDEMADVISTSLPDVYWLEAKDKTAQSWKARKIASVKATGHVNGQGFGLADIVKGGKKEILIGTGGGICMISIPEKPKSGMWPVEYIVPDASDEGFAAGDLDGDGDIDLVVSVYVKEGDGQAPKSLCWWENPGQQGSKGKLHKIRMASHDIDRIRVTDFNGDGRLDIVYTEERYPGLEPDAELVVLLAIPGGGEPAWKSKLLAVQYSMNNLDVGDVDLDGDIDLVTNEHKGDSLSTQLFLNDGSGNFTRKVIDTGKEMHLGAQFFDLDNDGDLDLFGHAWDNYKYLHLWRNELPSIRITDAADEDMEAFRIETASATYFYQKEAGGFSSMIDKDGNDWLGYSRSGNAQYPQSAESDFRGLPNMVYQSDDNGAGHPGFDQCTTTMIDARTLRTVSKSGKWQWSWTFHHNGAELTVEKVDLDHPYWFLFEGPIAGRFLPAKQYWGTNTEGPITRVTDYYSTGGEFSSWTWAYFGDKSVNRILLLEHLTPDDLADCMGFLGNSQDGLESDDGMVVFGFGREKDAQPLMTAAPNLFRISFREQAIRSVKDHRKLSQHLNFE